MNDPAIRSSYVQYLNFQSRDYDPKKDLLISEMGLCRGISRVDLAVVNGVLHGYEIKSDLDTLNRLPSQLEMYEKYFSFLTVVTTDFHIKHLRKDLPKWVGITKAKDKNGVIAFKILRKAKINKRVDKMMLVQLLWKQEALNILEKIGQDKGVRSKNKDAIWQRLAEVLDLNTLIAQIKKTISSRSNWQVVPPLT